MAHLGGVEECQECLEVADCPVQVELIWVVACPAECLEALVGWAAPAWVIWEARAEPREIFPSRAKGPGKPRKQGRDFPGRV